MMPSPTPRLIAQPITPQAYAPFGALLHANHPSRPTPRIANHGAAQAFDDLAPLMNGRGDRARPTAAVFRCVPLLANQAGIIETPVHWLERHPASTQMFVPMNARRYLLIVALGADSPDLSTLAAFVVNNTSAITYAPGIWHHPMIALDHETDFINFIWQDGTPADCHEVHFPDAAAWVVVP